MRSDLKNGAPVNSTTRAPSSVALESGRDLASPCSASYGGGCFKENINVNKSETPKLAMEPMQMKKRKKGGGYNLRKSLAWDRAFFTEEGVLDPLELSLISGASCGEGLSSFISESTPLKKNPLEDLPDEVLGKERRKNLLSPCPDSSFSRPIILTSPSSRKVSDRAGSKSRSRRADCPRPLPTSSLKRPAHVNVGKAAAKNLKLLNIPGSKVVLSPLCATTNSNIPRAKTLKRPENASNIAKELKLPKVPVSKAVPSPVCATTKSSVLRDNVVKHSQIAQPDFNTQRNAVLRSSSGSPKRIQNASKASSLVSADHLERNSGTISFKQYSSDNPNPGLADKADNSGPKMISDNMAPAAGMHSSEGQDEQITFSAPPSRSASVSGRTTQPSQNQTVKPSGLRMPSPSLSFFSQPKASVSYKLSSRNTDSDVCGSKRPGNVISQDNSRRTVIVDTIPESTSTCSWAVSSSTGCLPPHHVNAVSRDIIKPNMEVNSVQKVGMRVVYDACNSDRIGNKLLKGRSYVFDGHDQDLSKKIGNRKISREEAELQKIDNEIPSQSGTCEQSIDVKSSPVKSDTRESGRNLLSKSKQNYAPHESETRIAINEPRKEQNIRNLSILNQGAIKGIKCEDVIDYKRQDSLTKQSSSGKIRKPDFCESGRKETDDLIYSPGAVDKRTHKDIDMMIDKLFSGDAHTQDAICASVIGSCKNNINLILEVGDGQKQPGKYLEVHRERLKREAELLGNVELSTSDRLSSDRQICIRKSQEEKYLEKPIFVVSDRKSGNGLIDNKMASTQPQAERHDCDIDKDKMMRQPLIIKEFNSSNNPLSPESHINLINTNLSNDDIDRGKGNIDASSSETMMSIVARNERWRDDNSLKSNEQITDPAGKNLSISPHQDTQTMEIDYCSSLPESMPHEVSQMNALGKTTNVGPVLEDSCVNNLFTSTVQVQLKEGGTNVDNLSNMEDSAIVLMSSPQTNVLNGRCFIQSECLAFPDDGVIAGDIIRTNDGENLQRKSSAFEESHIDNVLRSMDYSVAEKTKIHVGSSTDSSISAHDSPLKHENFSDAYGIDGPSYIADTVTDPSRVEPFTETTNCKVSEDINSSVGELHTELSKDDVEVALLQNKKDEDSLNEKSRSLVIPNNAIPFSDEWLAAIEAAGEDILTKKSGAVQNSPTEKSLPEPSPWSPVKKKNNQIGPYDCTKFTNIPPCL